MARYPLNGNPPIRSKHGEATNMGTFGKHLGIDRSVVNVPFYAPGNGKVNVVTSSANLGKYIEAEFFGYTWRFAHLSRIDVKTGQNISEGQQLGVTGNTGVTTGPHLHYDARKKGTAWNASFNNYVDPDVLIAQNIAPPSQGALVINYSNNGFQVRETPGGSGKIIDGRVLTGQKYTIFDTKDGWAQIEFRGVKRWIGPIVWSKI